jgi:CHAT domain-containing protein/Tfp pilus assembly protein PilF
MRAFFATAGLICLLGVVGTTPLQAQLLPGTTSSTDKNDFSALVDLGNKQRSARQWAECAETYRKAIALLAKSTRDNFEIFYFRGKCREKQGKWPEAESDFRRALELYPDQPLVLNSLAYVWVEKGMHLDEALRMLHRAAEQRPNDGYILDSLGWANYRLGHFAEAVQYIEQARKLQPSDPDIAEHLGAAYVKVGRADKADELLSAASLSRKAVELQDKVSKLYEVGKYAEAIPLAQQVLAIRENALGPDHPDVADALEWLASLYDKQGRYAEAEPFYKRALAIYEKARGPDHPDVASALIGLGSLYREQGRYAEAEPLLRRALAIDEKELAPNDPVLAGALGRLASLLSFQGRSAEAESLFKRSLAIYEKALGPNDPNVAGVLAGAAISYIDQGRFAEAEPLYKRSLEINEKVYGSDHRNVTGSLTDLALLYSREGRYTEAEPLYKRALAIREKVLGPDHPDVAHTLDLLASVYYNQGRYADAEQLLTRSLAISEKALGPDHPEVATSLAWLAFLYGQQGRYADALPLVRRAIAHKAAKTWAALPVLFGAQAAKLISADEAIDHSLNVEQHALQTSAGEALNALAVRFAAGDDRLAQFVRKDQDLAGEAANLDKAIIAAASKEPSQRDPAAEQRTKDRLAAVVKERDDLQALLRHEFPDYAALSNPQSLTATEVQALLADDEALVVVNLGNTKSYVWVITRDAAEWKEIAGTLANVSDQVFTLRGLLDPYRLSPFDAQESYVLYQRVLLPVEDVIRAKKRLSVVLDGALTSLPPQLLVTRDPTGKELKDVDWLIRTHAVTVLPSVASLKVLRGKSTVAEATKPLVGFADPILGPQQLAGNTRAIANITATRGIRGKVADLAELKKELKPLPETATELRKVADSVHADPTDLFLGADATETRVKQEGLDQFRIVYFATHGLLAGDVADFAKLNAEPALVLSLPEHPTELDDGLLTASEVAQLKLNADWVVLSACNTASSDKPGAEALSGLARAFFYAGARSLVVSNWEVNSDAAVALMTGTFAALAADPKLSHAEALQKSMLAIINDAQRPDWADPKYWAPFVVVGEPAEPAN